MNRIKPYMIGEAMKAWLAWVDAGQPRGNTFVRGSGLCYNAYRWLRYEINMPCSVHEVHEVMGDLFAHDGLDPMYPFGGENMYQREVKTLTDHLNPERIAWARRMAE